MNVMEGREVTCCRMWITNMETMEKKNIMPEEVQRKRVSRLKKEQKL